jgi:hypothetical protein
MFAYPPEVGAPQIEDHCCKQSFDSGEVAGRPLPSGRLYKSSRSFKTRRTKFSIILSNFKSFIYLFWLYINIIKTHHAILNLLYK